MKAAFFDYLSRNIQSVGKLSDIDAHVSYSELLDLIKKYTFLAAHSRVGPGAICTWTVKNSIEDLIIMFSLFRVGAIGVPLFSRWTEFEVKNIQKTLGVCFHYENKRWHELEDIEPLTWKEPAGPGLIFFTSGTTGGSRFVFHSEKKLLDNAIRSAQFQEMTEDSHALCMITMSHLGGLGMQTLPALVSGASLTLVPTFTHSNFFKFCHSGITHTILVPSQYRQLAKKEEWKNLDLSHLKFLLTGSSPVDERMVIDLRSRNANLIGVYGLTEIGPFVAISNLSNFPESGVYPLGVLHQDYEIKLEEGEIHLKGPCVGSHIIIDGEIIRLVEPEWVKTGDLGKISNSEIFLTGRSKMLIDIGSLKVNPYEVEEIINRFPGVVDSAVTSDKSTGEEIIVAYVMGNFSKSELSQFLKNHLAIYKIPRKILHVDNISRTSLEKANYKNLVQNA
ncbi:MAG: hypothetical protein Fur0010_05870 [Bdellovibrio sp.]